MSFVDGVEARAEVRGWGAAPTKREKARRAALVLEQGPRELLL